MRAILTKFLPTTATKPSRIKAYDSFGNSVTVSTSNTQGDNDKEQNTFVAMKLAKKIGYLSNNVSWVVASTKQGYAFIPVMSKTLLDKNQIPI